MIFFFGVDAICTSAQMIMEQWRGAYLMFCPVTPAESWIVLFCHLVTFRERRVEYNEQM